MTAALTYKPQKVLMCGKDSSGYIRPVLVDSNGQIEGYNKGYFADETALTTAYPNSIATPALRNGWYAVLGDTDTIWVWDADTNAWVDTGSTPPSSMVVTDEQFIPVEWGTDGSVGPAAASVLASGAGKVVTRSFVNASTRDIIIAWTVPHNIIAATGIKIRPVYYISAATGPSAEGVVTAFQSFSLGNADNLNGTPGSVVNSITSNMTAVQYDRYAGAATAAMTDTEMTDFAAGEDLYINAARDHDHASNTYAQTIDYFGFVIYFNRLIQNNFSGIT